ncbi:hypothetical protein PHMEG_00012842 [Phytophthora megakarya]|uniref:Uncharacterized protein n=1 Tax=Phytophthora megakarya TaxID=4795 RepID=A0A225W7S7_9STRA|nr:hypothetical protein PHMEG_00012842 [Phytophthora megakarya]
MVEKGYTSALSSRSYNPTKCSFRERCRNALHIILAVCKSVDTGLRGVVVTAPITAGEVMGEYLGKMELLGSPHRIQHHNEGYRLLVKSRTIKGHYVRLSTSGGGMRLLNYSEQVTVAYGDKLGFVCRCGWWSCQYREV